MFLLFINDIAELFGDSLSVKLFADDVKIYASVNDIQSGNVLQEGLNKLFEWSVRWQLPISPNKCTSLHLGRKNISLSYNLNGNILPNVNEIKDLGILVDRNLKFKHHITNIVTKAQQKSCLILRCFKSRNPKLLFKAFTTYVRPILEYCCPVWSPVSPVDIAELEAVQRRFTKRLAGYKYKPYGERLLLLGADSIELRRLRLNLTMIFNIVFKFVDIDATEFFDFVSNGTSVICTRGHSKRIRNKHCEVLCRSNSFACRPSNINAWNILPQHVIDSPSTSSFKSRLKAVDLSNFITCF